MLVLSRKPGEKIYIGSGITITVIEVKGNKTRLGIDAPADVPIVRAELNNFLAAESEKPQPEEVLNSNSHAKSACMIRQRQ